MFNIFLRVVVIMVSRQQQKVGERRRTKKGVKNDIKLMLDGSAEVGDVGDIKQKPTNNIETTSKPSHISSGLKQSLEQAIIHFVSFVMRSKRYAYSTTTVHTLK
jgi:hypothetical protein